MPSNKNITIFKLSNRKDSVQVTRAKKLPKDLDVTTFILPSDAKNFPNANLWGLTGGCGTSVNA